MSRSYLPSLIAWLRGIKIRVEISFHRTDPPARVIEHDDCPALGRSTDWTESSISIEELERLIEIEKHRR